MKSITEETPIKIERVTEYDYDDVTKLMLCLCEFMGTKFDEDRWQSTFEKHVLEPENCTGFIARRGDTPVGMVFVEVKGKSGLIKNVYIIPEERNTVIIGPARFPKSETPLGELLLQKAIDFIREKGGKEALINLRKGVKPAEKLYQKMGFTEKYVVLSKKV
ncbi:MAG: GNAT family N-acetyltransferase [Candidatus Jordarchaeaceae archaeon]